MSRPLSLTTDPIAQLTWRIAIPASTGMFFNTMFNFVDTYCAGLLNTEALAALSLSFPVFFLLIAVGSGLSQGATALIANALGSNHADTARRIYAQSLLFALLACGLLSVGGFLFAPSIFRSLGASGHYLAAVLAYMNVILAGGIFFVLNMAINSALSAIGETRVYRNFLIGGFLANCVLDPLFIWGWGIVPPLGVAGLALATVLIQFAGCLLLWRVVRKTDLFQHFPTGAFRPDPALLRQIAAQSIPAALNMLTIALGVFVITWFVQHFGRQAVAAVGIATRIEQVILMPAIGIATAMISLAGQNHGAGLSHRIREAWIFNVRQATGLMLGGSILVWFFGEKLMRFFTGDAAVIAHGRDYLHVSALTLCAYPVLFITVFLMQGLKRPTYGLWIGLYRQVIAPFLVMQLLVFTLGWGLWGVWWGFAIVTWSAALFAAWWGWKTVRATSPAIH